MTPEALRDYLVGRGFTEDVAQDVVVSYLTNRKPIRNPQAWGVKAALYLTMKYAKGPNPTESRVDHQLAPFPEGGLVGREPDPLRCAIGRQELARAFAKPPLLTPRRRWTREQTGGFTSCLEDYHTLLNER